MLALIQNSTFVKFVPPGGWFEADGLPPTSPAYEGWFGGGFALVEFVPAGSPPDRMRRAGPPSYVVDGGVCTEVYELAEVPVAVDDVVAERDRRIALGFEYDFADARGVHHIGTTPEDMKGWDEVTKLSQAAILLGNGGAEIQIRTETGQVTVTATEWQLILVAAGQHRQPIWHASFLLQDMNPIPANYADDIHWPA